MKFLLTLLLIATGGVLASCETATPIGQADEPSRTAVLYRDDWGVPHIYAKREEVGFYALGYATAEDRLQRFLGLILFSRGEIASLLGPTMLETDIRNRMWRHREAGVEGVGQLSPQLKADYEAFLGGLRAYVQDTPAAAQFAELANSLDVADIIAMSRALFYTGYHEQNALAECQTGGVVYSKAMLPYRAQVEPPASNGWGVMPSRTAEKALILAADPHVEVESPAYYEFRLEAGPLKSAGFAVGPLLWQVHTRDVAWAMTTGSPDFLDCYEVETNTANPRSYLYDGELRTMEVRTETFKVAGGEPVTRTFEYTNHNGMISPVIARRGTKAYVASAADANRAGYLNEEIYRMNLAHSVGEVKGALATMSMFPQNLTIGDREGHLLYLRAGRAPRRPSGYDWTKPVPGNTSATAWQGFYGIDDLVQLADPETGYLQNDNAAPDRMTGTASLSADAYSREIFFDSPGRQTSRGERTLQVLSANSHMLLDDAMALSFDEMWVTAPDWIAGLDYAVAAEPKRVAKASPAFRAALARLKTFDGKADSQSEAAADFYFWRIETASPLAKLEDGAFIAWPWDRSRFNAAFAKTLLDGLDASLKRRRKTYHTTQQKLGDIVRVTRGAENAPAGGVTIDSTAVPLCIEQLRSICERTMRAFGVVPDGKTGRLKVVRGSQSMRLVQFTNPIRSFSLYAFGQSDDPKSPHYADQVKLFSEKRMKPVYFTREELEGHIASEKRLVMPAQR